MPFRTRITPLARERGLTAAEVARRLGLYRSNLSALDRGSRSVSLRALGRVAEFLDCGPADLLEVTWGPEGEPFRQKELLRRLKERDLATPDGEDRSWVHHLLLAWQRHYKRPRSRR